VWKNVMILLHYGWYWHPTEIYFTQIVGPLSYLSTKSTMSTNTAQPKKIAYESMIGHYCIVINQ